MTLSWHLNDNRTSKEHWLPLGGASVHKMVCNGKTPPSFLSKMIQYQANDFIFTILQGCFALTFQSGLFPRIQLTSLYSPGFHGKIFELVNIKANRNERMPDVLEEETALKVSGAN